MSPRSVATSPRTNLGEGRKFCDLRSPRATPSVVIAVQVIEDELDLVWPHLGDLTPPSASAFPTVAPAATRTPDALSPAPRRSTVRACPARLRHSRASVPC